MLAPSIKASAVTGVIMPAPAIEAISNTTATLEWQIQVSRTAASTAMIRSPSRLCMTARNTWVASMWPRLALSRPRARSISPNPISAQPMLSKRESSRRRNTTTPTSSITGMASEVSKLSSCTTRVEPILAPSITARAGARLRVPAAVNEVAIRLTAVLLCSTPVIPIPEISAIQRLFRLRPIQLRNWVPNPRSSAVEIIWVPHSNSAMAPARLSNRVVPDIRNLHRQTFIVLWAPDRRPQFQIRTTA